MENVISKIKYLEMEQEDNFVISRKIKRWEMVEDKEQYWGSIHGSNIGHDNFQEKKKEWRRNAKEMIGKNFSEPKN